MLYLIKDGRCLFIVFTSQLTEKINNWKKQLVNAFPKIFSPVLDCYTCGTVQKKVQIQALQTPIAKEIWLYTANGQHPLFQ